MVEFVLVLPDFLEVLHPAATADLLSDDSGRGQGVTQEEAEEYHSQRPHLQREWETAGLTHWHLGYLNEISDK